MIGKTGSGRKPGFKHSDETRQKISDALTGTPKSESHRQKISQSKVLYDLDGKCTKRYEALCLDYPDEQEFFEDNMSELIFAMRDVLTEKELSDIRYFYETAPLRSEQTYQYPTTSCYAAESVMIELLDYKRLLRRNGLAE
jgi:hypothetical protein